MRISTSEFDDRDKDSLQLDMKRLVVEKQHSPLSRHLLALPLAVVDREVQYKLVLKKLVSL